MTVETKCWENDWEILLTTKYLENKFARNCYDFDEKLLFINNVNDPEKVRKYAEKAKSKGVITGYHIVADYADEALKFFDIDKSSFGKGYVYSISELVAIYLCRTDYLLHFSGDTTLARRSSWIERTLELFERNPKIKTATPLWTVMLDLAKAEAIEEDGEFYIGYGFSDQCYLVKVSDFRARIYNETNASSARYPKYGGELFEKRVDAYMRNHGWYRATTRSAAILHKNFPRSKFVQKVMINTPYYRFYPLWLRERKLTKK